MLRTVFLAAAIAAFPACGQDVSPLKPVFSDDFSTDTRAQYKTEGGVEWERGKLTLPDGSRVERSIKSGECARVQIRLTPVSLSERQPWSELRVWFLMDGGADCCVKLRRVLESNTLVVSIARVDKNSDGKSIHGLTRRVALDDHGIDVISAEYRHGLVQVWLPGDQAVAGHFTNGNATVRAVAVRSRNATVRVTRLAASAKILDARRRSAAEQEQLDNAQTNDTEGTRLYRAGQYVEAARIREDVLTVRRNLLGERHPDYAASLVKLGQVCSKLNDSDRAEALYNQALEVGRAVLGELHPYCATVLNNLALLYQKQADYSRAVLLAREALAIRKRVLGDDQPPYADSLDSLAMVYRSMGLYERAQRLVEEALEIRRNTLGEEHIDYAIGLNNLGSLYTSAGDFERATPLLEEAASVWKKVVGERHFYYAYSLNNLAGVYLSKGEYDRAELLFEQATEVWKAALGDRHPLYGLGLHNLARTFANAGEYARAESLFVQAREVRRSAHGRVHADYATTLSEFARLYTRMGHPSQAEPLFEEALEINRGLVADSAVTQSAYEQRKHQQSRRRFLDDRISNFLRMGSADQSHLAAELWQWKGSVTARQQAYRRVARDPKLAPLFRELQAVARRLSVAAGAAPIPPSQSASQAKQEGYRQKREAWTGRVEELNREREHLEQQIAAGSDEFRRIQESLITDAVQNLLPPKAAFIDFLEYIHTSRSPKTKGQLSSERRYVVVVVPAHGRVTLKGIGAADTIDAAITQFRSALTSGGVREQSTDTGAWLREKLWLPLESHLEGIDTVIISPDSAIGTLPFGALPGRADGGYLIEDYRLASIPFAGLLRSTTGPRNHGDTAGLLLVGNVDYADKGARGSSKATDDLRALASQLGQYTRSRNGDSHRWESLDGFVREMEIVRKLYRQGPDAQAGIVSLSRSSATEDAFLAQAGKCRSLHVITHGFFADPTVKSTAQAKTDSVDGVDPFINKWLPGLLSGLVMAGANSPPEDPEDLNDGILRASEIEASSLRGVDLVVLSACETGLGAVGGGEGLTGLQRAFHVAGARSVIASFWKVDDRATQVLMEQFYTNLWIREQSKIDALRNAQLWMLRNPDKLAELGVKEPRTRGDVRERKPPAADQKPTDRTSPYLWAAFTLSGDWR